MTDYALVVGIETYQTASAKTLQGPSLDALSYALWLRKRGVPPENIILIHNKSDLWKGELDVKYGKVLKELTDLGVHPRETATYPAIYKAWREELLAGPEGEEATLWFYWSGHGITFPKRQQILLCGDLDAGNPAYFYLDEFRDSFRSLNYARFKEQRLVIDACAEHFTYQDLGIQGARLPADFEAVLEPGLILLLPVAVGQNARAEEGGSLFTRVLLAELDGARGWPADIVSFYQTLVKAIDKEAKGASLAPRLCVYSKNFEAGIRPDRLAGQSAAIFKLLTDCHINYDRYQPLYRRTMGSVTADPEVLAASSLTEIVHELMELPAEDSYGGLSMPLAEFLFRVVRAFGAEAADVMKWVSGKVPDGGRFTIDDKLDREKPDLALAIVLIESAGKDGFPVEMEACLTDESFQSTVQTWPFSTIANRDELEKESRALVLAARKLAVRQNVSLTIHVFANPPLLGVPYQAIPFRAAADDPGPVLGQYHPFVLRSRARMQRNEDLDLEYDFESWRSKLAALRNRKCGSIVFHSAPAWSNQAADALAKVDGLLMIREIANTPSDIQKLLNAALTSGLPLLSWRIAPPPGGDWNAFDGMMKAVLQKAGSLAQAPQQFKDERKREAWARETVLFWDDDDTEPLRALLGEEPLQQ